MHKMIRSIPLAATVAWKHNNFQRENVITFWCDTRVYECRFECLLLFQCFFCVYIFGTQTLIGAAVVFVYVFFVVKFFLLFLCLSVHWEAMFEDMQAITQNLTDG